jgi:hypothetical protein
MGRIDGCASAEIEAPIAAVYAIAADVEGSLRWQPKAEFAGCFEHDDEGNQTLVRMETDARVKRLGATIRFSYEPPTRVAWAQEDGDLKSIEGSWELEDLGAGRTRATYSLEVDLGRVLGMVVRGPLVGALRNQAIETMPEKLKRAAEADAA